MTTSHDIQRSIESLQVHVDGLNRHAEQLSLRAVEGDPDARKELAETQASLRQASADGDTLRMAFRAAKEREEIEASDEWEDRRSDLLAQAKAQAHNILAITEQVDKLAEDFRRLMASADQAEKDLWKLLFQAKEDVTDGYIGRRGIGEICRQVILNCDKPEVFRPKPAHDVATAAWKIFVAEKETVDA